MAQSKIQSTKNYRLFKRDHDNRAVTVKRHKSLLSSMKRYGFLSCFPIVCHRNGSKQLSVKDGQHRLTFAEMLGLPVFWVEESTDFDIAEINCTSKTWQVQDYAAKFAANGNKQYEELIEFASTNRMPLTIAAGILCGQSSWAHTKPAFCTGKFKITDREWAQRVVDIYVPCCEMSKDVRNVNFLQACIAACRVEEFDGSRFIGGAKKCREKLVPYSTREAYLDMIEEIYNFNRQKLFGIKAAAQMAMRDRNPIHSGNPKKRPVSEPAK